MPDIYLHTQPLEDINQAQHYSAPVGATPQAFYDAHPELQGQLVICVINRQPVLRADWSKSLAEHDVALFVSRPAGGGNSNPLKMIAMLAVIAFAGWAVGAGGLFGSAGLTGVGAAGVKLGITMAGSLLVNQILPLPQPPQSAKIPEPSPTYSLRGQSNLPRLGQPIPLHYGRHIVWPDLIMRPYYEYEGNDQYYHMLCCLGVGKIVPETWKFGDINLASLPAGSAEQQVAYPGEAITVLPAVVYPADMGGVELSNAWSASTFANPPATQVTQIGLDVAFAGLVRFDNNGNAQNVVVTVEVQYQAVNDQGTVITPWALLTSKAYSNNTVDTIRDTLKATVPAGRYEVRARVSTAPSTDTRVRDKCIWGGLRGYSKTHPNYGDVTVVAVRLKATELLSQQSTQQLNIVATRHLRHWTGSWTGLTASRSIIWALADLYTHSSAGKQPDNTLLLSELKPLHDKLHGLSHFFDYRFDQSGQKLLEAMQIAARAGRCSLFNHFGYWRLTRDDARAAPVQMFTADNIKDFQVSIALPQVGEPDGIIGEFISPDTWQATTITIPKPGLSSTPTNPETVQLAGITGRDHAWAELTYLVRAEGRRESGHLVTGMEGRIPILNDLIAISPDGINWGEGGSILAQSGQTLTLSNATSLTAGKIMLRGLDGKPLGTYDWTGGGNNITAAGVPTLPTGLNQEPCYYILGANTTDLVLCRVQGVERQSDDYVKINFVVEDSSVYATPGTTPTSNPGGGGGSLVNPTTALNILWAKIAEKASGDLFALTVTWSAVATAKQYALELSTDGGTNWKRLYTGDKPNHDLTAKAGALKLRVAAINGLRGAWYVLDYTAGSGGNTAPPPGSLGLQASFIGSVCRIQWDFVSGIARYRLKIYDTATLTERRSLDTTANQYEYSYLMATDDGGPWRALTFRLWSVDPAGNLSASYRQLQVSNPQIGALTGVSAIGFQGQIMIEYDWPAQPDAAGVLVFMSEQNGFIPSSANQVYDGADTVIGIPSSTETQKYIKVAGYDWWGQDALTFSAQLSAKAGKFNPFDIVGGLDPIPIVTALPAPATYKGPTTVSYQGKLYQLVAGQWQALVAEAGNITSTQITDGSITTPKLAANSVVAGKIAANAVTTATIQAAAISADKIAANSIGADKLMANSVVAGKISVATLSAINANMGTITAGLLQNASQRAVFNLNATGTTPFIRLRNTLEQDVFRVQPDGNVYVKGTLEATQLIASSAIIGTALIQDGATSSFTGTTSSAVLTLRGNNTYVTILSYTYAAVGRPAIIIVNAKGSAAPAGDSGNDSAIGNAAMQLELLQGGVVLWAAQAKASSSGAWYMGFTCVAPALSGSVALTLRIKASSNSSNIGNVNFGSVQVFQAKR